MKEMRSPGFTASHDSATAHVNSSSLVFKTKVGMNSVTVGLFADSPIFSCFLLRHQIGGAAHFLEE
jgi:hypothetical protein